MGHDVFFCTEMPSAAYPQDVGERQGVAALMLPHVYFGPRKAP
jgi:hypothetical protein